jgi:hypothetical protein
MVEVASTSNLGRAARTSVAEVKVLGLQDLLTFHLSAYLGVIVGQNVAH